MKIKNYIIGKCLSDSGAYGIVRIVKNIQTEQYYVMKIMIKDEIHDNDMIDQILAECNIHKELKHPNIVNLIEFFEDEERIYVVLEYMMKGDLFDIMDEQSEGFKEKYVKKYMKDIASGIDHLHQNGIVHRDIKLENILIDDCDVAKLADFGWAAKPQKRTHTPKDRDPKKEKREKNKQLQDDEMSIQCGTFEYMAPEMLLGEKYDEKVDVWSMGLVMYELLVGSLPFNMKFRKNKALFKRHIIRGTIKYPKYISRNAIDLMKKMLEKDPKKRISAKEALEHQWIS